MNRGLPATQIRTLSDRPNLGCKIDPKDSRFQLWFIGDEEIMRLSVEQARKMAGLLMKLADRQDEMARGGARIVVPANLERAG
jgi:hypothetical protein